MLGEGANLLPVSLIGEARYTPVLSKDLYSGMISMAFTHG
jgi:hypothetical protein